MDNRDYKDAPVLSFRPLDAKESKPQNVRRLARLHALIRIAAAVMIALFVLFRAVVFPVRVRNGAMSPALSSGSVAFVTPAWGGLERGKIVAFTSPSDGTGEIYVRRIVALGGQTVEIKNGVLLVDGLRSEESYLTEGGGSLNVAETTVPKGFVYVLGDDRASAADSRDAAVGAVDVRSILGVVRFSVGN